MSEPACRCGHDRNDHYDGAYGPMECTVDGCACFRYEDAR